MDALPTFRQHAAFCGVRGTGIDAGQYCSFSAHTFNAGQIVALANLSRWAFLLTFAGVGLRTNFREMSKQGLRPFIVGALGEILIAGLTLGLVVGANAVWGL
jgi:hypothetical protein